MFRRKLQRWLPDPESLRARPSLRWCAPVLGHPRLWHLHRRSVALGVAIGLVTGLIPGPVQMLLAVLLAIPLRANIPAAVFTTLYTNPITFIPLYILAYNIGKLVTGGSDSFVPPPDLSWSWDGMRTLFPDLARWLVSLGDTLVIGLAIQLATFAVAGYFLTLLVWRVVVTMAWRRRQRERASGMGRQAPGVRR